MYTMGYIVLNFTIQRKITWIIAYHEITSLAKDNLINLHHLHIINIGQMVMILHVVLSLMEMNKMMKNVNVSAKGIITGFIKL